MKATDETNDNKKNRNKQVGHASQYALEIALQTIRQRCEKLESRLLTLDKCNKELKAELKQLQEEAEAEYEKKTASLKNTVVQLKRQKEQLSHHIYKLGRENHSFWSRFSALREENSKLKKKLEDDIKLRFPDEQSTASNEDTEKVTVKTEPKEKPNPETSTADTAQSEDDDSDVSIITIKENDTSTDEDEVDVQLDVTRIIEKLNNEKTILKQFHTNLTDTIDSLLETCEKEEQDCPQGNQEETEATDKDVIKYECSNCHRLLSMLKLDETDDSLSSFEVIKCVCQIESLF